MHAAVSFVEDEAIAHWNRGEWYVDWDVFHTAMEALLDYIGQCVLGVPLVSAVWAYWNVVRGGSHWGCWYC